MPQVMQQQAVKAAVVSVLASMGLLITGCDAFQNAKTGNDRKAMAAVKKGDYQAATAEKNTTPLVAALSNGLLADSQYAASTSNYRKLAENQIDVGQTIWSMNRMADDAVHMANLSQAIAQQEPQAILGGIDTSIKQIKGDGSTEWVPAKDVQVTLPSQSATNATMLGLKDRIGEIERNVAIYQKKRGEAQTESQNLLDASVQAKGQESVELYKKALDCRSKAEQLANQIEQAQASAIPFKQDLAQAEALLASNDQAVEALTAHIDTIQKNWRGANVQAEEMMKAANRVYAGQDEAHSSVLLKARRLAELLDDREKVAGEYERQAQAAISAAQVAVKNAQQALADWKNRDDSKSASGSVVKLIQPSIDPNGAMFVQGNAQYGMAVYQLAQSGVMGSRARLAAKVAETAKRLNQKLPDAFDQANLTTLKQDWGTRAGESLRSAGEQFGTVSQAPLSSPMEKEAASVSQMLTLHAAALLSRDMGDSAASKQNLDEAKAIRDRLVEGGRTFHALPDDLAAGMALPKPPPSGEAPAVPTPAPGPETPR